MSMFSAWSGNRTVFVYPHHVHRLENAVDTLYYYIGMQFKQLLRFIQEPAEKKRGTAIFR